MNVRTAILFAAMVNFSVCSIAQNKKEFLLNENFDSNKIGWTEELTAAHKTGIQDGFLYIFSIDSTKEQSSNGPQNLSFLWDLPKRYEITTAFYKIKGTDASVFGIMLNSSSLSYKFSISEFGVAELSEYDYNSEETIAVLSKEYPKEKIVSGKAIQFRIIISGRQVEFFVNNESIGKGTLKAKSWEDIRLFATTDTAVKIDYLKIKKLD